MFRNEKLEKRKNDFLEKMTIKYQDQYDFSNINYVNMHTNITYICNTTKKSFTDTPWSLLQRRDSSKIIFKKNDYIKAKTQEEKNNITEIVTKTFIEKAKKVHGSKYDYSKVIYVKAIEKVTIICPVHGEFQQRPNLHLQGCHCFECGKINRVKENAGEQLKTTKPALNDYYFYIIYCYNGNENFYKIGSTKNSIRERYGLGLNKKLPYNYHLIFISKNNSYTKETFILNALSKYQYKPTLFFKGHTECIKIHPKKYKRKIKKILKLVK